MKASLKIETHDRHLGFELAGAEGTLSSGMGVAVPGGATVTYQSTYVRKAFGIPEILEFIVESAVTIDLGLFSAWLYEKVKDKPVEKIVINRREITEITQEGIRKVMEEEIRTDGETPNK